MNKLIQNFLGICVTLYVVLKIKNSIFNQEEVVNSDEDEEVLI